MPYIHFTEEQKNRAASVDLEEFLRMRGEKLTRSGGEKRMASDHSVTIRGSEWYDHATEKGGGPISFVRDFYGLSYPEAVSLLLDGEQGVEYPAAKQKEEVPPKPFELPPVHSDCRRVYAYLLKQRHIDREVISHFVKAGLLYEDVKYHNCVFVGTDENGVPRHAHKRSTNSYGEAFRINVEGSDPHHSFHHIIQYKKLYAYEKGEDGSPKIIPEQAEVVVEIYKRFLAGSSLRMIQEWLEQERIPNVAGEQGWTIRAVRNILTNEKYCGDVLLQKTFIQDCISKKVIKNTGQLPQTLVQNHHEGIVDRETYDAVQAEFARRNAGRSPSKKNAPTGLTSYASKYALSERLVCGECGTLYRRCTWNIRGKKKIVWRCVSRLDYGKKYCHDSPTLEEETLQRSILSAINSRMSDKGKLIQDITESMELEKAHIPGESISLGDIQRRLEELDEQTKKLVSKAAEDGDMASYAPKLKAILDEVSALKEKQTYIAQQQRSNAQAMWQIRNAAEALEQAPEQIEWSESTIRQLVDTVKVLSKDKIEIYLRGGTVIEQNMIE